VNESDATDLMAALFDLWYSALVRYAIRATGSYERAEDLAQDAFMQLYQALRAGKHIEHPKAWTICVLRRAMKRQLKDRNLHEQLDEMDAPGDPPEMSKLAETGAFFRCSAPCQGRNKRGSSAHLVILPGRLLFGDNDCSSGVSSGTSDGTTNVGSRCRRSGTA